MGFGLAAPGGAYPAIYVVGTIGGVYGIFRSDDQAATWTRINDDRHQFGLLSVITGDPRIYGRVYLGTSGRGIKFGDVASLALVITSQPSSQSVSTGQTATFTVAAAGTPAPSYQWSFNGASIAGATSSTLTLNNVQSSNAGSYTVTVSNGSGSVTSNAATLTVNAVSPQPTGGGDGGGGGGGAPSIWFSGMLLSLVIARRVLGQRSYSRL